VRRRGGCACTGATSMHCARPPRGCFQYSRLRPKISETELWVSLPTGAEIRLFGADNPDALRWGSTSMVALRGSWPQGPHQ
jgi:hypothetical protein